MKIRLPWGESGIELSLPRTWRVIAHAQPKSVAASASVEEEFLRAMSEPVGRAPLASRALRGKRVVIVVDDSTRPTPAHLFFPHLLRELERRDRHWHRSLLPHQTTHVDLNLPVETV